MGNLDCQVKIDTVFHGYLRHKPVIPAVAAPSRGRKSRALPASGGYENREAPRLTSDQLPADPMVDLTTHHSCILPPYPKT